MGDLRLIPQLTPDGKPTSSYSVYANNGVQIGELYQEIDGFYVFALPGRTGYWPEYLLRELADELKELNIKWLGEVTRALEGLNAKNPDTAQ